MNTFFKNMRPGTYKWIVILLFSIPQVCMAAGDLRIVPAITIKGEYSDNVYYTRVFEESDFITKIRPTFSLDYITELLEIESDVNVNIRRYADENDLDAEDQHYKLKIKYKVDERFSISANGSYNNDSTLESQILETGLAGNPIYDRDRFSCGISLTYQATQKSTLVLDYNHINTDYEWEGNTDYDNDTISLAYNSRFNNQLDVFTIKPYYSKYDATISKTDNYGISFGLMHPFSETLTLTAFIGPRYTKTGYTTKIFNNVLEPVYSFPSRDFMGFINTSTGIILTDPEDWYIETDEEESNYAGVIDVNLKKTGELYSAEIGYNQDLGYDSYGNPIKNYSLRCNINKSITERFRVSFSGNIQLTKSNNNINKKNNRYYTITPSLSYNITENHALTLTYNYSQAYDKLTSYSPRKDRNRVWLMLRFKFPGKWGNNRINFDSNSF